MDQGQPYPSRAVRGAAPGKQQPDDVQVVVMDGHVQGSQAILQGQDHRDNSVHSAGFSTFPSVISSTVSGSVYILLYIIRSG